MLDDLNGSNILQMNILEKTSTKSGREGLSFSFSYYEISAYDQIILSEEEKIMSSWGEIFVTVLALRRAGCCIK